MNKSYKFSITANNKTNVPLTVYLQEPSVVTIIRMLVEVFVAFLGVCGNGVVCFTITRQASVRSTIRYYIKSLAIADIGVLLLNFPVAIVKEQLPYNWPFGEGFCLYVYPVLEMFHGSSIWSIAAIALERYRYVALSIRYARHSSRRTQRRIIAAIWISSFVVVSLPLWFVMKYFEIPTVGEFCFINWPVSMFQAYNVVMCLFWYLLPLTMIMLSYVQIAKELRASKTFHDQMNANEFRGSVSPTRSTSPTFKRTIELNYKAKKILTPIVCLFAVTMFPLNLLRVLAAFWEGFRQSRYFLVVYNVSVLGVVLNSAADPLVYYFATKDLVKGITVPCQKLRKKFRKFHLPKGSKELDFATASPEPVALVENNVSDNAVPNIPLKVFR